MITEIERKNNTSQEDGTAPNLGGPTSTYLADTKPGINDELRAWAHRFIELNQGGCL